MSRMTDLRLSCRAVALPLCLLVGSGCSSTRHSTAARPDPPTGTIHVTGQSSRVHASDRPASDPAPDVLPASSAIPSTTGSPGRATVRLTRPAAPARAEAPVPTGRSSTARPPAASDVSRSKKSSATSTDSKDPVIPVSSESPAPESDSPSVPAPALAVDLPSLLSLAEGQNPNVSFARERIWEAYAQQERADALWLPSLRAGVNWNKHEGRIQDVAGKVIDTSRGSYFTGLGADAVGAGSPRIAGLLASFHLTDAIFQPRIAENTSAAREHGSQAVTNDTLLETALAYLEVLRAAQDVSIAREILDKTRELARITRVYADAGQGTRADDDRARTELSVRANDVIRAEEAVQVASARLAQLLHIDLTVAILPRDPAIIPLELVAADQPPAHLVSQGLTNRPEVCENRFLVNEAVERLKREKYAPLVPSVLLGLSYGGVGGGFGSNFVNFGDRLDADAVAYWEVRNLGFGERAARNEAASRLRQTQFRELALLDRVAREVVESDAQVRARRRQITVAREAVEAAEGSYEKNWERILNVQGLPLEVLQSIQALAQARREYLRAVIDHNAAQFRLHHSLGWPGNPAQ